MELRARERGAGSYGLEAGGPFPWWQFRGKRKGLADNREVRIYQKYVFRKRTEDLTLEAPPVPMELILTLDTAEDAGGGVHTGSPKKASSRPRGELTHVLLDLSFLISKMKIVPRLVGRVAFGSSGLRQ